MKDSDFTHGFDLTASHHFLKIENMIWLTRFQVLKLPNLGLVMSMNAQPWHLKHMSHCMGKPTICLGENKGADQLCSNCEADQRLCFRSTDSTIPLPLSESKISIL